jgi:hypothetical protein
MDVQFFGEVDRNSKGEISSVMPAWYFDAHVDDMAESIARKKRSLKRGEIPPSELMYVKSQVEREEKRLEGIQNSKPDFGKDKDRFAKAYDNIGKQISDLLPTRSDELMGYASPREELQKSKTPCVSIDVSVAKACGVSANKGKITRDEAIRCYRMIGKAIGDNTNTERLRKDGKLGTYRSTDELTDLIMKKMKG